MNWVLKGLYLLISLIFTVIQILGGSLSVADGTAPYGDRERQGASGLPYDDSEPYGDADPYSIPYGEDPYGNADPYYGGEYGDGWGTYGDGLDPYGGSDGFSIDPFGGYQDPYGGYEDPYGGYGDPGENYDSVQIPEDEIRNQYQEMGAVLRELGLLQFTEERMEAEADEHIAILKELSLYFPQWVEYYLEPDYLSLLSSEGYGSYDDNWVWYPSSDSVYSFDCEVLDTSHMYTYFLRGVLAISGEEFSLTYIEERQDEVDFYSSSGTQTISFRYNDTPYYFRARYMGDWMDCTIIDYVNYVLETEGNPKRLWCIGDGGQGYIVFYNTEEWADQFQETTGLELSSSYLNRSITQAGAF